MKVAVLVERLPQYRTVAPVIDAALERGWPVQCWHPRVGATSAAPKPDMSPTEAKAPAFRHGRPEYHQWTSGDDLFLALRREGVDVVISGLAPASFARESAVPPPRWVAVQFTNDFFYRNQPSDILSCDLLAFYSRWWVDQGTRTLAAEGMVADADIFHQAVLDRTAAVGQLAVDAAPLVDSRKVRARWRIPENTPVVLLLPFPQGVGKAAFWPKAIFGEPRSSRRVLNVLRHGRFDYLREAVAPAADIDVVRAIRRFCDRQGAFLLVKSRLKTPVPDYLRRVADHCVYDEGFYPSTIVEALSVSSLCISYYSMAVTEAVALRVPHLTVTFDMKAYVGEDRHDHFSIFNDREGSLFQFKGVTASMTIPDAIRKFPALTLDGFTVDPVARECYVTKYLGYDDRAAGRRFVAAMERLI